MPTWCFLRLECIGLIYDVTLLRNRHEDIHLNEKIAGPGLQPIRRAPT